MSKITKPQDVLVKAGSYDESESRVAVRELAKAMELQYSATDKDIQEAKAAELDLPLRKGVMDGNNIGEIFTEVPVEGKSSYEYPLDLLAPGTEGDYTGYTMPNHGYIPQKAVEADYLRIPIFQVGSSIDAPISVAQDADWNFVGRMQEVMVDGIQKKHNDDGWHTLLGAGYDRNLVVVDSDASTGQFTKRLVTLMQMAMERNGGGNTTSMNRTLLTDMYMSLEAAAGMRDWNVDQADEITRREVFTTEDSYGLQRIYGINMRSMTEFGVGQEYQTYWTSTLGATMPSGKNQILVGLDNSGKDAFISPVKSGLQVFEDPALHRQQRFGFYCWSARGWGVADNRKVVIGAI